MTVQPVSPRRWLARASMVCTLILAAWVGAGSGCSSSPAGTGGSGTGAAGSTSTTTSSSSTTSTSTGNPMSSTGVLSGPMGTGGMSGTGGMGGAATGGAATGGAGGSPCATLTGSADYPPEVEPNNMDAQANPLQANAKGFTAAICPLGDVDIYTFTVTASGSAATITTSDGMGGCPTGAHTLVRVYDNAGNVLALDTGANGCVSLTPTNNVALGTLGPGTYYVHVESATLATIPTYTLDINVKTPGCGDGIVQVGSGEQCDDGPTNGMSGDVCSATCQLTTGSYRNEIEPNDTLAEATSLDGYTGAVGEIYPATDVDSYYVDVLVAGSSITATISDGKGGCSNNFDSILSLYSPTKALLVSDKGGGVKPCSKIAPQVYNQAANLAVGRYYLQVARISTMVMPYYVLDVKVSPPSCGDHIVPEGNKQCDPVTPNPGCSATCQLTGDFIPETEQNGAFTTANSLTDSKGVTHAGFIAAISPVGDQDYFSFTVTQANSLVVIQTGDGMGGCPTGFTSSISLYTSSHQLLVNDTRSGVGTCSLISPNVTAMAKNLAIGTYYVAVNQAGNNATQWEYVLSINVYTPGCGDDYLENGEQCDDGAANGTTGDGCTNTCTSIAPWEIEPNGGIGTATPAWAAFSPPSSPMTTWKGEIKPLADHDYFSFLVSTPGIVTVTTHDLDNPSYCSSDTQLYVYNNLAGQVGYDDDHGPGPGDPSTGGKCSSVTLGTSTMPLQPGVYFALVKQANDNKQIGGYQLDVTYQ